MKITKNIRKLNSNGITLVALIVTIIILLILAGITITMILNQNGIFKKAELASIQTRGAVVKEQAGLWKLEVSLAKQQDEEFQSIEDKLEELKGQKLLTDQEIAEILKEENTNQEITIGHITTSFYIEGSDPISDTATGSDGVTKVNKPVLAGLNKEVTYYTTWGKTDPYQTQEETTIKKTPPSDWYDYSPTADGKKWANIKTTGSGNDAYWVWIPRYAYKVPVKSNVAPAEGIEIKFLEGITNKPTDGTAEITNTTPTPNSWVVHPAFNFGGKELKGIWIAKYEASSSNAEEGTNYGGGNVTNLQVRSVPGVTSWRNIQVSNIFTVCRKMEMIGNTLGLSSTGLKADGDYVTPANSKVNSHMIKNMEWGMITYLSRSKYGKNTPIWINCYGEETNYTTKTGVSGTSQDATTTIVEYSLYNTGNGPQASTTGNVYGIYDMSGGSWEYVSAYVKNGDVNSNGHNTVLLNSNEKYREVYEMSTVSDTRENNYKANIGKYGDAMQETSSNGYNPYTNSWDIDYSDFAFSTTPVFLRRRSFLIYQ